MSNNFKVTVTATLTTETSVEEIRRLWHCVDVDESDLPESIDDLSDVEVIELYIKEIQNICDRSIRSPSDLVEMDVAAIENIEINV